MNLLSIVISIFSAIVVCSGLFMYFKSLGRKDEQHKQIKVQLDEIRDVNKELESHRTDDINTVRDGMSKYTRED